MFFSKKWVVLGIAAAVLFDIPVYAREVFKGSEFLEWTRDNQEFYIRTSYSMGALIVAQYDKTQGKCLDSWFADDEQAAYDHILGAIRRFPEFHPRGTLVAVMEKQCGKFSNQ